MTDSAALHIKVKKRQGRFKRVRLPGPDQGVGTFFFLIDMTAGEETLYVPLSIASGKKPTGFVYQIEGTTEGAISTTDISVSGAGVTQVTLGTLLYAKIPAGKTATFRIAIEMRGRTGKEYQVSITQVSYKRSPSDARYQKLPVEIPSELLKFR